MTLVLSVWGKGGVGKTTLSAVLSRGLWRLGYKVLALSTDPVPTLSEALGLEDEHRGLDVVEVREQDVVELWKQRFGEQVYRVVSSFLPVGREIIDYIAGAPGIADQFSLYMVYELWRRGKYDFIVWDTAAAGGSLRLLRLEYELYSHLGDAAKLYLRVKSALEKLRRGGESPLRLIEEWRGLAGELLGFLSSENHRALVVTTPDPLGASVTERMLEEFRQHGIVVERIIVNMAMEPYMKNTLQNIYVRQKRSIEALIEKYGDAPGVCRIPLADEDLRGEALEKLYPFIAGCLRMEALLHGGGT